MTKRSPITTHVLDTASGRPAAGVAISLRRREGDDWRRIGQGVTDADGRLGNLLPAGVALEPGIYQISFEVEDYFKGLGQECFYPSAAISFHVRNTDEHYHVPLLISGFGYSTYRGS